MKKIDKDLYIVEPNERITIAIESINTENLAAISLDGETTLVEHGHFAFHASTQKGTTHHLVFLFNFAGSQDESGSYHVNLTGSAGGTFNFSADLSSSQPVKSLARTFRVGSAEIEGPLGIDPPEAWPHG